MNIYNLKIRSGLGFALLIFSIASMAPVATVAQRGQNDATSTFGDRPEREQYDNRAFPESDIAPAQQAAAAQASRVLGQLQPVIATSWQGIGPTNPVVAGPATFTFRPTTVSGRVTALALSAHCGEESCRLFVGAAGGGVWVTGNALALHPSWHPSNSGIPSNSIGSIIFDPTDPTGKTLYVGTGEPNGSSDSEAGVGLFKSTDLGQSWTLVPGSFSVANGRGIASIAVDPVNSQHIFIGTAVARHGLSSTAGGRFTPPGATQVGLYESNDGGATFNLAFSVPSDTVNHDSANGSDFFRGGVSRVVFSRTGVSEGAPSNVYISVFDYGVYRSDGAGGYEQIFASAGGGAAATSSGGRNDFALAPHGDGELRIYLGDTNGGPADFYRVDNALVPAATLTDGTSNPGWMKLSNSTPGTPGFASYNFCTAGTVQNQCWYDMVVASPPGRPDTVWILGAMQYNEIAQFFGASNLASNGRAVQRSTDAGVSFTDMTDDTQSPPLGMHPDQHAIAFVPGRPDIAIVGSDGGVIRTSGSFADASATCDTRGLKDPQQLSQCHQWLSAVPTRLFSMNIGLVTLQFQSLSINARNPLGDIMGGTQDNGTWAFHSGDEGEGGTWFESVGGDGGASGTNIANPNIRMHTYTGPVGDVNFNGTDPLGWDFFSDPLISSGEAFSFYSPLINDPGVGGTWFIGGGHVWRTLDNAGSQAYLDKNCSELLPATLAPCGDWEALGATTADPTAGNLVSGPGSDKGTGFVAFIARSTNDTGTMWVGTRRGRVFISHNADATPASNVTYTRLDTPAQPRRFVSAIVVDHTNSNHAWVTFSGYEAYTPTTPGHVFEVTANADGSATWNDLSFNLGDQPITGIARDDVTGNLFVATDFGVNMLPSGDSTWVPAGTNLPPVAVYGLTINPGARVLYAATHGRSAWRLRLSSSESD